MLRFRKVLPMKEGKSSLEEAKNKKDQKKYEEKVTELRSACENFRQSILNEEMASENSLKTMFNDAFSEQMKKNKLFSRTSKLLHEMSKKLSKFKGPIFNQTKAKEYAKAFEFKAEKPNDKGYIKRSAIDDKFVANFFNNEMIKIFKSRKVEMKAQSKIQEISAKAEHSLEKSDDSIDAANKIIEKIDKTIEGIEAGEVSETSKRIMVQHLNKTKRNLENAIENATKQNEILEAEKDKMASSAEETIKSQTVATKVETQTQKNDNQTQKLTSEVEKASAVVTQTEENAETAKKRHEEKLKEMEETVKKAENCYGRLKTEVGDKLDELVGEIEKKNAEKKNAENEKEIKDLVKKKGELVEEWNNASKECSETFNTAKLYDDNMSIDELDKKIEDLKKLMTKFETLIKEYKLEFKGIEDILDDRFYSSL